MRSHSDEIAGMAFYYRKSKVCMGFSEIYLFGTDCDFEGNKIEYFYAEEIEFFNLAHYNQNLSFQEYGIAKHYADAHGIKIYNATRGGKLEVFDRVDFDSLFRK